MDYSCFQTNYFKNFIDTRNFGLFPPRNKRIMYISSVITNQIHIQNYGVSIDDLNSMIEFINTDDYPATQENKQNYIGLITDEIVRRQSLIQQGGKIKSKSKK